MADAVGRQMMNGQPPKKRGIVPFLLWLSPIPLIFFAASSVALIIVGMLPTFVAAVVDRREEKYTAYTVGGFNLCGVLPFLAQLWDRHNGANITALYSLAVNPFVWFAIYGSAAIGWLAFTWIPRIVIRVSAVRDRQRLAGMMRRQEALIEEWGPEVSGDISEDANLMDL